METYILTELQLDSGVVMKHVPVAYQTWGTLSASGDNAVVVCHALTGNTEVDDWWGEMLGPGKALDTSRYFIVAANVLGSPYGSASPLTVNPDTEKPYGATFPQITIRDTVRAHHAVLKSLGVKHVVFAIGGSMGGMQVLEWAFMDDFVQAIIPVAVGGRHSPWCIAWSEAQRQAIFADSNWKGGRYSPGAGPENGLAAARMMAMVSYRSAPIYQKRFGRKRMHMENHGDVYEVQSYLAYQGEKLVDRFDANCYVQLTNQMDTHDVSKERGEYEDVLKAIQQPTLVVGIDSDVLYPLHEQHELATHIPGGTLEILSSPHGHDAFLIELQALNNTVLSWLDNNVDKKTVHVKQPTSTFQLTKNGCS